MSNPERSEQPIAACPTCGGTKEKPRMLTTTNWVYDVPSKISMRCTNPFHSSTEQGSQFDDEEVQEPRNKRYVTAKKPEPTAQTVAGTGNPTLDELADLRRQLAEANERADVWKRNSDNFGDLVGKQTKELTEKDTEYAELQEAFVGYQKDHPRPGRTYSDQKWRNIVAEKDTQIAALEEKLKTREGCSAFIMRDCPTHGESKELKALREQIAALQAVVEKVRNIWSLRENDDNQRILAIPLGAAKELKSLLSAPPSTLLDSIREEAAKKERERCAKIADKYAEASPSQDFQVSKMKNSRCIAAAIRSQEEP